MITINPNNYIQLLQTFPPRPIKSEKDLLAVQDVSDRLVDADEITPSVFVKRYSHEN
jgi:HTH-type transcriptional regulator/antitoxin HigA